MTIASPPPGPCGSGTSGPSGRSSRAQRHGGGDPAFRVESGGRVHRWWLGWRTPEGPRRCGSTPRRVTAEVDGARRGGPARRGRCRGCRSCSATRTTPPGFVPGHPVVAEAARRLPGYRVPRSGLVVQTLVPVVIEQKVTGQEAFAAYRLLVRRFGEPAPGPGADRGLRVPPTAAGWAAVPSWEWLRAGVDGGRSRPAVTAGRVCRPARGVPRRSPRRRPGPGWRRCPASAGGRAPRWPSGPSATPTP